MTCQMSENKSKFNVENFLLIIVRSMTIFFTICIFCNLNCSLNEKVTGASLSNFFKIIKLANFKDRVKFNLLRIHNWSIIQNKKINLPLNKILLYPFGGGDILYPLLFFSETDTIIIVGLEPAGKTIVNKDFNLLSLNLSCLYEMGYFRTRQMEKVSHIGMLTLMYHQLRALSVTNIKILYFTKGFKLIFDLDNKRKKVIYYSLNLNNRNEENWFKKLKKYKNFSIFVKAGSYILQQKGFEKIKNFLISRCDLIIQDDTGFDYKYLLKNKFHIKLYGLYTEPLIGDDNFDVYFQKDLMKAYLKEEENLNIFDISYNEANWLIAFK